MLELYHTANSVCAQKIRIQLAEKALSWTSRMMTLRGDQFEPGYLKLNPNAVVPTLVHDGVPIFESSVILYYLEDAFPNPSLMPTGLTDRVKVRLFNKLIDEAVHNACTILTFATALRSRFQAMNTAALEAYLSQSPSQQRSAYKRDVIENGLTSLHVKDAVGHFDKLLAWIEQATMRRNFLAGDSFSVADAAVIPYVVRLELLRLADWIKLRPGVEAWYRRVRSRPSIDTAIFQIMTDEDYSIFKDMKMDPWPSVATIVFDAGEVPPLPEDPL